MEDSDPPRTTKKLTPCSPGDPKAKEMTWNDIGTDDLLEPPLYVFLSRTISKIQLILSSEMVNRTYTDFLRAVQSAKPTVSADDIKQHMVFAQEGGSE